MTDQELRQIRDLYFAAGVQPSEMKLDEQNGILVTVAGAEKLKKWVAKIEADPTLAPVAAAVRDFMAKTLRGTIKVVAGTDVRNPAPALPQQVGCGAHELLEYVAAVVRYLLQERIQVSLAGDEAAQGAVALAMVKTLPDRLAGLVATHDKLSTSLMLGCPGAPAVPPVNPDLLA